MSPSRALFFLAPIPSESKYTMFSFGDSVVSKNYYDYLIISYILHIISLLQQLTTSYAEKAVQVMAVMLNLREAFLPVCIGYIPERRVPLVGEQIGCT